MKNESIDYVDTITTPVKERLLKAKRATLSLIGATALFSLAACGDFEGNSNPPTAISVEEMAQAGCEVGGRYTVTGFIVKVDEESDALLRVSTDPISGMMQNSFSEVRTSIYNLYPSANVDGDEYIIVKDTQGGADLPLPVVPAPSSEYANGVQVIGKVTEYVDDRCVIDADSIKALGSQS